MTGEDRLARALGAITDEERGEVAAVIEDAILYGTGVLVRHESHLRRVDPAGVVLRDATSSSPS